jgi:hypothetical protein
MQNTLQAPQLLLCSYFQGDVRSLHGLLVPATAGLGTPHHLPQRPWLRSRGTQDMAPLLVLPPAILQVHFHPSWLCPHWTEQGLSRKHCLDFLPFSCCLPWWSCYLDVLCNGVVGVINAQCKLSMGDDGVGCCVRGSLLDQAIWLLKIDQRKECHTAGAFQAIIYC